MVARLAELNLAEGDRVTVLVGTHPGSGFSHTGPLTFDGKNYLVGPVVIMNAKRVLARVRSDGNQIVALTKHETQTVRGYGYARRW